MPREAVDNYRSILSPQLHPVIITYEFDSRDGCSKITLGAQDLWIAT